MKMTEEMEVYMAQLKSGDVNRTAMRQFETGATRDTDEGKPCYIGFLSMPVIKRFGEYMHNHRRQSDGNLRAADNWKKGIPQEAYMDSLFRHTIDAVDAYQKGDVKALEELLCAIQFNQQGMLHELLKEKADRLETRHHR